MESVICIVTFVIVSIPVINTIFNPLPFQQNATIDARKRGWNESIIKTTRALPFLTLFAQVWFLLAIYTLDSDIMFVTQAISWVVFVLYHGMNFIDPVHLAYHPKEMIDKVIKLIPPIHPFYFIIWCGLHYQHTLPPFYLYYLACEHDVIYNNNKNGVYYTMFAMSIYCSWHMFCWKVQGIPAYPFLKELRKQSQEMVFYTFGATLTFVISYYMCFK
jgi:hypothetical protein